MVLIPTQPLAEQLDLPRALCQPLGRFLRPPYLANLVQAFLNLIGDRGRYTLILATAPQPPLPILLPTVLSILAANELGRLVWVVGPPLPALIAQLVLQYQAQGAIALKTEATTGEPTIEMELYWRQGQRLTPTLLEALAERTQILQVYRWQTLEFIATQPQSLQVEGLVLEILDSLESYQKQMTYFFDFDVIQSHFRQQPLKLGCCDELSYYYTQGLLEQTLGLPAGTVILAPNASQHLSARLSTRCCQMMRGQEPVSGSDSLALLVAQASLTPFYSSEMLGIARSYFASVAVDHVCAKLHLPYFQTAELWADLTASFEAENVTLAGNSQGEMGGAHSREADGLWALLFWLNILASKSATVESLVQEHWHRFGRNYHGHYHYQCSAHQLWRWTTLTESWSHLNWRGKLYGPYEVAFTQLLPLGGYELGFTDGSRLIFCPHDQNPSASFHLYLERYEPKPATQELTPAQALQPLLTLAQELLAYP